MRSLVRRMPRPSLFPVRLAPDAVERRVVRDKKSLDIVRQWRSSTPSMIFYETDVFTARIVELIDDESYATLQALLVADPEAGDLIPKTRGLRKIRWMGSGRGKRG